MGKAESRAVVSAQLDRGHNRRPHTPAARGRSNTEPNGATSAYRHDRHPHRATGGPLWPFCRYARPMATGDRRRNDTRLRSKYQYQISDLLPAAGRAGPAPATSRSGLARFEAVRSADRKLLTIRTINRRSRNSRQPHRARSDRAQPQARLDNRLRTRQVFPKRRQTSETIGGPPCHAPWRIGRARGPEEAPGCTE
jgi:hypothetical protein